VAHLTGAGQEIWFGRLAADWDNLRAALGWSLSSDHEDIALRICGSIWRFWSTQGLATEGRNWIQQTLDVTNRDRTRHRVAALFGAGYLAEDQNDLDAAFGCFQRSLDLAEAIGDTRGAAPALNGLGTIHKDRSEYPQALSLHTRAKSLSEAASDGRGIAVALGNMGSVHYFQGSYDQSEACWTESTRILRGLGDVQGESMIAGNLGALALDRGDLVRARELLTRTLTLQRQLADKRSIAFTLTNLGEVWFRCDDFLVAREFYAEALALFREFGDPRSEAIILTSMARLALAQGECAGAAGMLAESTQTLASIDDTSSGVDNIELLANVAVRCRAFAEAAELFGAAGVIRKTIEAPVRASLQAENDEGIATARRQMGEDAFVNACEIGRKLDFRAASERVAIIAGHIVAGAKSPSQTAGEVLIDPHRLTVRELDVLHLLSEGQSTREIAATLYISPRTASTHVTNILGKLGVTSRAAAVAHAMRIGLV
jgi:ATP/maltotriose-dependent transcriptional regulator MalT